MPISQSIMDNAATALFTSMLPKAPMDVVLSQAVAIQAKTGGIATAGEKAVDLVAASKEAREISKDWKADDALKLAMDEMLVTLMSSTAAVGKQAAESKLPK